MATRHFRDASGPPEVQRVIARVDITTATLVKVAFAVLLMLATLWVVKTLSPVIVLTILALLLAVVLSEFVNWLQSKGVGRGLAATISIVSVLVTVGGVLAITFPPLIGELNDFFTSLPSTTEKLREFLSGSPGVYEALANSVQSVRRDPSSVLTGAFHLGFGVATNLFAGILLLTLAFYFLIDGEHVRALVLRITPAAYRTRVDATMSATADVIKAFFIGRSLLSGIYAIFTFLLLTVLGVPYSIVFAVLAFFLGAIPNIGSFLGTVGPALVALAYRGITIAIIVVAALMTYQQIENNFMQPRVMSKKLNVRPIATMIGVLAGGKLLGIVGVILAIPVVGILPVLERIWIRGDFDDPAGA